MQQHSTLREGVVVGVLGATAVAVWFLVVDMVSGRAFDTPMLLGSALFGREVTPGGIAGLPIVLGYTAFHYAAFIAVGLVAAWSTHAAERRPVILAFFLVLFVVFESAFYGLVAVLDVTVMVGGLAWVQIALGNLLATVVMGTYLWKRHPAIAPALSRVLSH